MQKLDVECNCHCCATGYLDIKLIMISMQSDGKPSETHVSYPSEGMLLYIQIYHGDCFLASLLYIFATKINQAGHIFQDLIID